MSPGTDIINHGVWPPPVPLGGATSIYRMKTSLSGCARVWLQLQTLKKKKKERKKIGFPRWRSGEESARQCRRHGFNPWVKEIPGKGNGNHSSILVWEIPGRRSLAGYSPWAHKESDMTERPGMHTHKEKPLQKQPPQPSGLGNCMLREVD